MHKNCSICYREDLLVEYRKTDDLHRMSLYEKYPYMREIFNTIELKELEKAVINN